jgi:tetraspanin-13/31
LKFLKSHLYAYIHLFDIPLQLVGILLISVGIYGRAASLVVNLPIISGILVCGIILIIISMLGLAGAVKHHQVMLFFYMIILFLLFLVQFSIACACLAVNNEQQREWAANGWNQVSSSVKEEVQNRFSCCGFNSTMSTDHPSCDSVTLICCPVGSASTCKCSPCMPWVESTIDYAFRLSGGIGLFFSFTEVSLYSIIL